MLSATSGLGRSLAKISVKCMSLLHIWGKIGSVIFMNCYYDCVETKFGLLFLRVFSSDKTDDHVANVLKKCKLLSGL